MLNKKVIDLFLSVVLVVAYICGQYIFAEKISALSSYASYYFDLSFVAAVWLLFSRKIRAKPRIILLGLPLFLFLFFGMAAHFLAIKLHLIIPFDLTSGITILFLLLVGPILEELVFRYALWEVSTKIFNQKFFPLLFTSGIFSFSHLYAYWSVPNELHSFVIYQAVYTFLLGLALGFFRRKYRSLLLPVIAHFAFNLGFYIVRFI
jgi:membrane protease YdiL (CAAX protease family)